MVLPLGEVRVLERLLRDRSTRIACSELAHDRHERPAVRTGRSDAQDEHEAVARKREELSAHERPLGVVPAAGSLRGCGLDDARILFARLQPGEVDELPRRDERLPHDLQRRLHPLPPRERRAEDLVLLDNE